MVLSEYGRTLFNLNRLDEALAVLERANASEPWDSTLQVNLGMSLAAKGRMADAAKAGERAVALDPEWIEAWNLYFNAMREAGRPDEAREGRLQTESLQRGR